jgi:archaellum component FlaF (FlaF/FlaG flagellin family)
MRKLFILLICVVNYIAAIAQPVCDSVTIEKVHYDPFFETEIRVNATNHSSTFIGYPIFKLLITGATIAEEQLHKFGFVGESYHTLGIRSGTVPQNNFHGYLMLTGYDSVNCVFERDFSLCPDTCQMIYPFIGYFGPTAISGALNWTIEKNNAQVVASGQLVLDPGNPSDRDSVCLSPGAYTFKIRGSLTPGENPYFSINTKEGYYFQTAYDSSGFDIPFNFFKRCPDPTGILVRQPQKEDVFHIYAAAQTVHIVSGAGVSNVPVSIYTIDGKQVYANKLNAAHSIIDLSHVPAGVYMVRVAGTSGIVNRKVVLTGY